MNKIGKFDCVLNEEHRDIVADQIPVSLLRVKLDRKATHVTRRIDRAGAAGNRRKARKKRRLLSGPLEQIGLCDIGQRLVVLEITVRARAPRVNDAFGIRSWSK
jgi:hypothetical protein